MDGSGAPRRGGNDLDALEAGLRRGIAEADRPSLLVLRTTSAGLRPHRTDTKEAHGDLTGAGGDTRHQGALACPSDQDFYVPDEVPAFYAERCPSWAGGARAWEERNPRQSATGPLRGLPRRTRSRRLADSLPLRGRHQAATRKAINKCLNATSAQILVPRRAGDLTGNTGSPTWSGARSVSRASRGAPAPLRHPRGTRWPPR